MNNNVVGITAKLKRLLGQNLSDFYPASSYLSYLGNILFDPMEHLALVEQTSVQTTIIADFLAVEKTQGANAIVEVDKDHILTRFLNDSASVMIVVGIDLVSAALNVQPDRELGARCCVGWSEYVDI